MTTCWHWIINCSISRIFQGSDSPGKDTLRTPLQILSCRFPVLDTIGLGLALSWRIADVCPWQECFPKKCTSRGSNSDNISDRVLPWLRASSPVEYYSWMPRSVSLHTESGYSEFCLLQGLGPSHDFKQKINNKKKKKKKKKEKERPTEWNVAHPKTISQYYHIPPPPKKKQKTGLLRQQKCQQCWAYWNASKLLVVFDKYDLVLTITKW